jgi:hypothetical protein
MRLVGGAWERSSSAARPEVAREASHSERIDPPDEDAERWDGMG